MCFVPLSRSLASRVACINMRLCESPGFQLHVCVWPPQEELYSYVTVAEDQTFKGKTNVTVEAA